MRHPRESLAETESSDISRRDACRLALIAGFTTLVGSKALRAAGQEQEPLTVNEKLQFIANNLPEGMTYVDDFHEDADVGIVNVPVEHWGDFQLREDVEPVVESESDFRILLLRFDVRFALEEGVMAPGEPPPDPGGPYSSTAEEQGLEDVPEIAELGALGLLKKQGLIHTIGGERTKEYDASAAAFDMPHGAKRSKLLYEDREDANLDVIARWAKKGEIIWEGWGRGHNFGNNVRRRNKLFRRKLSLLTVITPAIAKLRRQARRYAFGGISLP